MRHLSCVLVMLAGMVCMNQTASAQSPWYVEGSAGALLRLDASRSTTFYNSAGTTGPGFDTTTFDPGYTFNLGLGYKLPLGFRVEVEGGYAHYTAKSASPISTNGVFPVLQGNSLGLTSGGGHDQFSATFNAFYDLPISGWIVPYLGAGAGVNTTNAETGIFTGTFNSVGLGAATPVIFTQKGGSSTNAVILAEAGAVITVNANWSVVPSYRFEKVITDSGALRNEANIFKLGLRYSL